MVIDMRETLNKIKNTELVNSHTKIRESIMVSYGIYSGQWENGVKHGEGAYNYPSKDTYSGWWQFGKKQGKGTYIYADTGMRLVGDWEDNKIVRGRWILPNGTYYEGEFSDNKPNKQGTWYFKDGNQLKGTYTQTKTEN